MEQLNEIMNNVILAFQSFGILGGFLLILLESIIPILPLGFFIGINVFAYGKVLGFVISYVATICGCMISFTLFRKIKNHEKLKHINNKNKEKAEKLSEKLSKINFSNLVLILSIPFTPAFLINIAAGLTDIKYKKYLSALLISKIFIAIFWGYIGASLIESITDFKILIKIGIMLIVAYIISKIVKKVFKVEE